MNESAAPLHAVLVSVGTDGDIFPYVGLGVRLRERGHRVTLVASGHYEGLATMHGLEFRALISSEENFALLHHPDFWHPIKTARLSAKWGVRFIERQYALLAELARDETSVFIAVPAVFAVSLVHEKLGRPLANLIPQPWMLPSVIAPPVMPMFAFPSATPRPIVKLFWRALDVVGDVLVGRELNRIRASLELRPVRRIFQNWFSQQLVLGMFPEWFAPPPSDWPAQTRLAGFPLFDGVVNVSLPPGVQEFCLGGPPPVAFTFGTGMKHARERFHTAVDACAQAGVRGIFITRHRDQLPDSLPPHALHCPYAPFEKLFPQCGAIVHHGGIGTTARALAAGLPQLIAPIGFDQMDNGTRVQKLGAGEWLKPKRQHSGDIAAALKIIMTPESQTRCRAIASRFRNGTDAFETAADLIEVLAIESQRNSIH